MKFYVHHRYTKSLDYKLAHNLENPRREDGRVSGLYKGREIEFIFDPLLHDSKDGFHVLDWYACEQEENSKSFRDPEVGNNSNTSLAFLRYCNHVLTGRKNWIITFFRGEKLLIRKESFQNTELELIEKELDLLKDHKVVTDNYFLNSALELKYPHLYYALTNVIFQWNETWAIRWYVEIGEIHKRLKFDWDLIYSIRNHKITRIKNLIELEKMNLERVLLQRSDSLQNDAYWKYGEMLPHTIKINSIHTGKDFDKLDYIKGHYGYLDAYLRVLLQAKMILLDESWSGGGITYTSQYLSEKTFGVVLAGIPFIPTHTYPLDILRMSLGIDQHPFYREVLLYQTSPKLMAEFIKEFMSCFEKNLKDCENWVNKAQSALLSKVRNENSLIDLVLSEKNITNN